MKLFKHTSREKGMWRGWRKNGQSLEITWGRKCTIGIKVGYHSHGLGASRHLWLGLALAQVFFPIGIKSTGWPFGDEPSWGFYADRSDAVLTWGQKRKRLEFPWAWEWYRTSYQLYDGSWLHELRSDRSAVNKQSKYADNFDHWRAIRRIRDEKSWRQDFPYKYTLKNGTVQERTATVSVEQREWRRKMLLWTRFLSRKETSIDVRFDGEVGERSGSWKGGAIGCSYTMEPGETPHECLLRMERDRKFR